MVEICASPNADDVHVNNYYFHVLFWTLCLYYIVNVFINIVQQ